MMKVINVEIKAMCIDLERIRRILLKKQANFIGKDHQVDTYFRTCSGRLKLREGTIENNLIWYQRPDQEGPKTSRCILYKTEKGTILKDILEQSLGLMVVVDKEREIYFIENIKIHLDRVKGLGTFLEIEAQSEADGLAEETLNRQCRQLMDEFGVRTDDLVSDSYSDLIMNLQDEDY
jgi:predicted adenylyl cyclase CyaB